MPRVLVVYNICGLSSSERVDYYKQSIDHILDGDFCETHVALSGCMTTEPTKESMQLYFGDAINYNWVQDVLPVNITFNHCVQNCVAANGAFDAYVYVDSGIDFGSNVSVVSNLYNIMTSEGCAMVATQVDSDSGYQLWNITIEPPKNYLVKIGQTCNLHCQLFSHEVFDKYDKKLMPDVFAHHTTESIFSFVCAAIQRKFMISGTVCVQHCQSMNGPSSGFRGGPYEVYLYKKSLHTVSAQGKEYGFGYEECRGWFMHDPAKFSSDGMALDERLHPFIRENMYLTADEFDYGKINHVFKKAA